MLSDKSRLIILFQPISKEWNRMATVISLREVVEAMEVLSDNCVSYLDPDTGEIVTVTEEERRLAEDESLDDVPDWEREMLPKIRLVLQSDRFLELPSCFDIHEWSMMEGFAQGQDNDRIRQELLDAVHGVAGKGSGRTFSDCGEKAGYRCGDSGIQGLWDPDPFGGRL
jgi:hypothetical protein